ncbi:MAG: hypothetical protein AAF289_04170 [Cyanobacteria bacterium P01_A01_bin.135]
MRQLDSSLAPSLSTKAIASPRPPWRWLLASSVVCAAMGAAAVGAFLWLLSVPTAPNCERLSSLAPDIDRLYCAQAAAASGDSKDLLSGLNLMSGWQADHPLYAEAQGWMSEWSEDILAIAQEAVRQGDLDRGRELAQRIPPTSPSYDTAKAAIADWDEVWQWGQGIVAQAEAALQASNWSEVTAAMQTLRHSEYRYWRVEQPKTLAGRMTQEKAAHRYRAKAVGLAKAGTVEGWRQAIATAQQIDPQTFVWKQIQTDISQWGNSLLAQGLQKWYAMALDEAIAVGELVADVTALPALSENGHDLVILSRARGRATASVTNWEPTVAHLWELNRAIATVKTIAPDSRFYPQAQASIASWERQLQDLSTLYQARLAADGGETPALSAAIARAANVEGGRLRRLQAQTLTAHWQREIERIEDGPVLQEARQLATSGRMGDLQSAIARASQIQPNRALYADAQAEVGRWRAQVQTIQDRPILDRARRYAAQGQLRQAIAKASTIGAGRALTAEARGLQRRWQAQIDAAARPAPAQATEARQSALDSSVRGPAPAARPRSRRATSNGSTTQMAIPRLVAPPQPEVRQDAPLFNQQAPGASYPADAPPPVPATTRFSPEALNLEQAQPVAPAAPSRPSATPAPAVEEVPVVVEPTSTAQPLRAPAPASDNRQSAAPDPQRVDPDLQSQQPAVPLNALASELATPSAAIAQGLKMAQPSAPETIVVSEPLTERARAATEAFLQDSDTFPLLYAGPLFAV